MYLKRIFDKICNLFYPICLLFIGLIKSIFITYKKENDYLIDVVVTWVDGSDENWLKEKEYYKNISGANINNGNGAVRYRNWQHFRYWFRCIEKYAPWVNNIYFVTCGHVPHWLDTTAPKLKIVNHKDFIPQEFLPTFSSIPIEMHLHRIPGLSEHFIYFNDDIFLSRPCKPEDFFKGGKPLLSAQTCILTPVTNHVPDHILFSSMIEINKENNIRKEIEKHPELWFSYIYGRGIRHNLYSYKYNYISSLYFSHMGVPWCKSIIELAWKKYPCLEEVSSHKFRISTDCTHILFTAEHIFSNHFVPVNFSHFGRLLDMKDYESINEILKSKDCLMCCFTDSGAYTSEEVCEIDRNISKMFEEILPELSTFERQN